MHATTGCQTRGLEYPSWPAAHCRHKAQLPLVSRRWRDLLHSSELLSSVSINLCLSNARASAALQSLFAWLAGWAAGRVRHLELALECPGLGYGALGALMQGEAGMEMDEAEEALWASLRACGAGGQLRQLSLALDSMLYASPQALGPNLLSSLQRLCLDASLPGQDPPGYDDGPANLTLVACGLEAATALTELKLSGGPLGIAGGLPPSLTKLGVSGYTAEGNLGEAQCLPCQVRAVLVWPPRPAVLMPCSCSCSCAAPALLCICMPLHGHA